MDLQGTLRELARRADPAAATLTLTLNVSKAGIPKETQVFLKDQVWPNLSSDARPAAVKDSLKKTARRVRQFIEDELHPATDGLYLTAGPDHWTVLEIPVALRNFVTVGDGPYLPPLIELRESFPRAYVVCMRGPDALISQAHLGSYERLSLVELWTWERDVQNQQTIRTARARASGTSVGVQRQSSTRDRHHQKVEREIQDVLRRAAEAVGHYHAVQPAASVAFAGRSETFEPFRRALPTALREAATFVGSPPREERDLAQRIARDLAKSAGQSRDRAVTDFQRRHREGHHVAVGPEDVLNHVRTGTLDRVFLFQDDPVPGLRCGGCATAFPGLSEKCVWCGGALGPVSLAQELARGAAARPGFDMTFVPAGSKWLKDLGSVVALTRSKPRNG